MLFKIKLQCPICFSTNAFSGLPGDVINFICEDCMAEMSRFGQKLEIPCEPFQKCIVCGCEEFFSEYIFPFLWLRKNVSCYCCETTYIGYQISRTARQYSDKRKHDLRDLECCRLFRKHIRSELDKSRELGFKPPGHPDRAEHMRE